MDWEREPGTRADFASAKAEGREVAASGPCAGGPMARARGRRRGGLAVARLALFAFGAVLMAPVAVHAGDAPAADAVAAFTATELEVKLHLRDKAHDALVKDIDDLAKTSTGVTDPKLQSKYRSLIGSICQGCNEDAVQKACLKALGESKDPAMFRYVRPFLNQPNTKDTPPLLEEAIVASGKLVADDAVGPLLRLVKDSKVLPVAQAAMKALSTYGTSKRMRVQIVKELSSTVEKDRPGVGGKWDMSSGSAVKIDDTRTGEAAQARWGALSPELVKTLNALTGQNCPSAEEWFHLIDKYKADLGALFASTK